MKSALICIGVLCLGMALSLGIIVDVEGWTRAQSVWRF